MGVAVIQRGFLGGSVVKNPPASAESQFRSLGSEDPLGKEMATHSSIVAWKNPVDRGAWWATVHGVIQRVRHNLVTEERNVIKRNSLY